MLREYMDWISGAYLHIISEEFLLIHFPLLNPAKRRMKDLEGGSTAEEVDILRESNLYSS